MNSTGNGSCPPVAITLAHLNNWRIKDLLNKRLYSTLLAWLLAISQPSRKRVAGGGLPLGRRRITPCFSPTRVSSCPDLHPARRAVCVPRIPRVDSRPPHCLVPARRPTGPRKHPPPFQKGLRHRWIVSSSRSAPRGSPVPAPVSVAGCRHGRVGAGKRGCQILVGSHPRDPMRVPIGRIQN